MAWATVWRRLHGGEHFRTAQVHVTPLHTRGFVGFDAIFNRERRGHRGVEHLDRSCEHFDFTCGHIGVHGAFGTRAHGAAHFEHVFTAQMLCLVEVFGAYAIGVDNDLRVAFAVAQVNEDQATVVAVVPHPAAQASPARQHRLREAWPHVWSCMQYSFRKSVIWFLLLYSLSNAKSVSMFAAGSEPPIKWPPNWLSKRLPDSMSTSFSACLRILRTRTLPAASSSGPSTATT